MSDPIFHDLIRLGISKVYLISGIGMDHNIRLLIKQNLKELLKCKYCKLLFFRAPKMETPTDLHRINRKAMSQLICSQKCYEIYKEIHTNII